MDEFTLRIFRFDPEDGQEPRFDAYRVPYRDGMTVLEALFEVLDHQDGSIAFRFSCRGAVCGACAMFINGSHRLACQTQVKSLGPEVTVSPLPHLPVIRDLIVDMEPFWRKYEEIKPYLIANSEPPEKERPQDPEDRKKIDEMINCILCGACYSSCPMVWTGEDYLGPAALLKAYRFVADSRDDASEERLAVVSTEKGVWRCHTVFNCAEVCPRSINITWSLQQLKKLAVRKALF